MRREVPKELRDRRRAERKRRNVLERRNDEPLPAKRCKCENPAVQTDIDGERSCVLCGRWA